MVKSWGHFYNQKVGLDFFVRNTACHLPFFELLLKDKPKKVLEIGSGTGSMAIFLSHLGLDVTSLDNNKMVLKNAKALAVDLNGKVNFKIGDAFNLPFKDSEFDLIFHQGLLEHFDDEQIIKLLTEQLRVANEVIFSVPNNLYGKKDYGNERLLSKNYWDKLLSQHFKLVESSNYNPERRSIIRNRITLKIDNTFYLAKIRKIIK